MAEQQDEDIGEDGKIGFIDNPDMPQGQKYPVPEQWQSQLAPTEITAFQALLLLRNGFPYKAMDENLANAVEAELESMPNESEEEAE